MTTFPNLPALYSNGTLKLKRPLSLQEGTEVMVTVMPVDSAPASLTAEPKFKYPTVTIPAENLRDLVGMVSLGGDALADSEALYDGSD
jgi:predicted DNA-binding antitoxin AbrB/MazE fold protein